MRLEDLLHGQAVQQEQTVNTTTNSYRKRARELTEAQERHKKVRIQTLTELSKVEEEVNANHDLVKRVIADINRDVFIPESLHNPNLETKKLILESLLPELAMEHKKTRAFTGLVNFAEQHPEILPINASLIADQPDNPTAANLVPLWERALSQDDPTIQTFIMHKIVRDMEFISNSKDLSPLVKAIYLKPELVNLSIPEDENNPAGPTTPTPAMSLAEHNRLAILQKLESNLRALTQTPPAAELSPAYNFFTKPDSQGNTIVHYALKEGHKELALWLLQTGKLTLNPLEQASKEGNLAEVQRLLTAQQQDPTVHDQAVLMWAILFNHEHIVDHLLSSGLVDVPYNHNISVITAIRYHHLNIAKMLINAGANPLDQYGLIQEFINKLTPAITGLTLTQVRARQTEAQSFIKNFLENHPFFKAQAAARQAHLQSETSQRAIIHETEIAKFQQLQALAATDIDLINAKLRAKPKEIIFDETLWARFAEKIQDIPFKCAHQDAVRLLNNGLITTRTLRFHRLKFFIKENRDITQDIKTIKPCPAYLHGLLLKSHERYATQEERIQNNKRTDNDPNPPPPDDRYHLVFQSPMPTIMEVFNTNSHQVKPKRKLWLDILNSQT